MANTTNYNWETPDDTDLVKDGAAAIRTLGNSVDTTTKNLNPQTTLGDLAYRSATSNVNTRLGIGSAGQVLTVASGVPSWATPSDQTPLTTKGDLFTFTTVDARLGIGANNTVLTADSAEATGMKWAAPAGGFVGCSLYDTSSTQSIANGTNTALTWDSESFDTDGFHSTSSNTSRITVPSGKGGKYLFTGATFYAANATGVRVLKFFKNGSELFESNFNKGDGTNFTTCNISALIDLVATDYIELVTLQNSGGNLNAYKNSAPFYGWLAAQYLGA